MEGKVEYFPDNNVEENLYVHDAHPFLVGSPDAVIEKNLMVEVKCHYLSRLAVVDYLMEGKAD